MSAAIDTLRSDVHKPPEQLEREADNARNAVEGTLAELEHRLSPGELLDRVMGMVKRHGGEFGDNLLVQIRNNPLPTLLAGVGMAWLMTASKEPPAQGQWRSRGYGDGAGDYDGGDEDFGLTERWSSAYDSARDTASSAYESARDRASSAADSVRGAAWDAMDATSRAAHRAADATRHTVDRMSIASQTLRDGYDYLRREQPLLLGAIAVTVGAALGAMLPATSTEDELLGETADEAKARLRREASARASELRGAAADAAETFERRVRGDGDSEARGVSEREMGDRDRREREMREQRAQSPGERPQSNGQRAQPPQGDRPQQPNGGPGKPV